MSHIEKCRNLYYATLKVPEGLREKLGRTKFKQSLGTADKRRAQQLAAPLVALWKAQIRQALGEAGAIHSEALRWRDALLAERAAGDPENVVELEMLLTSKAEDIEERRGLAAAEQFADVALGLATPSTLHYEAWAASIAHLAPKTQDQMKKDVKRLTTRFSTLEEATPQAIRQWVDELASRGPSPASPSSVKRMVTFWRSYWNYLEGIEAVPVGSKPFALIRPAAATKKGGQSGWVPFKSEDVPALVQAAKQRGDTQLTDLIVLGAYTGARIEELCALKLDHIRASSIRIVDSKTDAGIREVPIHPELRSVVDRLKAGSSDGYLLAGLTFNKYEDRSNAVGKRFGRLKTALGHGPKHVFHSLRKTLVTMLEDAGVSENLAADIVGHEKPRITYGLYSGGASLATKAEALARVRYEGLSLQ